MKLVYKTLISLHKHILKAKTLRGIVQKAIEDTISNWENDTLRQETVITDILGTWIQDRLNDIESGDVNFTSLFIPDHGKGTMEKNLGADLAASMKIIYSTYVIRKLFLAQAKIVTGDKIKRNLLKDLKTQCENMLSISPYSIVMLYSSEWIYVVPAADARDISTKILKQKRGSINFKEDLYYMRLEQYIEDVYTTWQGDRVIGSFAETLGDLQYLLEVMPARTGLSIIVSQNEQTQE